MKKNYIIFIVIVLIAFLFSIECLAETTDLSYEYIKHTGSFRDMAISDDGAIVTVGTNGKIYLIANGEWLEIQQPIFENLTDIEYGNGTFFVISENSVYASNNGMDWSCVNLDLDVKETGVFYYNGNGFIFEKENISTTESGITQMKADDICLTKDFISFEKIGEVPLENKLKNDIFSNSKKDEQGEFSIEEAYQIMFGSGTMNTRNIQRRIKLFSNLTHASFPVSVDNIKYLGQNNEIYEVFYVSDYNLIRATTIDFENWETSIVALPDKCEHLYNVDVMYKNGYYIKYQTNESYNYDYTKNLVYSMDLRDFTILTNITEEDGNLYVFDELYVLKNRNAYRLDENQLIKCFEIPNNIEKATIKYSNGKYIKWIYDNGVSIYLSDDGVNWNKVESPSIALTARCSNVDGKAEYDVIWDGTNYVIRPTSCDNGYNPTGEKGSLFVCDKDLNFLNTLEFDNYILDMSFEDGKYNVLTNVDGLLHSSTDLANWQTREMDVSLPLTNDKTSIVKRLNKAEKGFSITDCQTKIKIKEVLRDVLFEKHIVGEIIVNGENYIKKNENSISLSNDGAYWHTIQLPKGITSPRSVYVDNNTLYVKNTNAELKYDIANLYNSVHTYVEVGGKILGFDTEPIIESDRTLVPLRFIFETLGADVDWEDSTRTAIVQNDEATILFSIDNTTASVNSVTKSMDVPARLVNDKTMVPLRFLSEELGFDVDWDEATRTATISK